MVTASAFAAACSSDGPVSSALPGRSAAARPAADSATVADDVEFHAAHFSGYLLSTGRR
jgi:hypothetical protein